VVRCDLHRWDGCFLGNGYVSHVSLVLWLFDENLALTHLLIIDKNNLNGTIPKEIAALRSLSELHIYTNQIHGTLPSELGTLTNLTFIDLEVNALQGTLFIPEILKAADTLKYFRASNNNFTGSIPTWIGNLSKLQELWATGNSLTGSIPNEITTLTNLGMFVLSFQISTKLSSDNDRCQLFFIFRLIISVR